jgi:benzoylformate decarboxylase
VTARADAPPALSARSVRGATFELLRARGMTTVFGNPGSTELGFLRDFPPDFRYVLGLHEGVVVAMADGYAQATGRPAFVNLHSACGVGNAMGAVVNAFHNRAPLVITAGNQDRRHLQREPYLFARSTELMAAYVKRSDEPARAQDVPTAIDRAWQLAQNPPPGPVFVSVPMGDWDAPTEPEPAGEFRAGGRVDAATLQEIAEAVMRSHHPAIVTGAGVDRDGAWSAVVSLAEHLGAPVWAAPQAPRAGFPENHPLFAGHLAPGRAAAAAQLEGCDLGLVLGAPVFAFLPYQPGGPEMPELIHVTDDPDEAARAPTVLSVVAEVGALVEEVLSLLVSRTGRPGPDGAPPGRRATAEPAPLPPAPETPEPISAAYLMAMLGALLPPAAVVVEESPSNRADFRRHVPIRTSGGFYATASGGLGFAMPAAVGIKLADGSRPVICVVGDGSALYVPQALWSAVALQTAVTFVVVNNARYAILESAAQFAGLRDLPSFELPGVDFVSLARSFGCQAATVSAPGELREALCQALESDRPYLLNVAIDPTPPPLLSPTAEETV